MQTVAVENFDDGITLIAINRPQQRNAISAQVALDLQAAFAEFDRSEQRVAVLTGTGNDAFSAGADFKDRPELWRAIPTVGISTEKPIIAAVAGWCVGGALVVAMMSDLLVAAENAKFSYPEAKLGFTGGVIAGLVTRIPHKIAMEIMLLGRTVDAHRAVEVGLANEVAPTGQHVERALELAREIAQCAPLVVKTIKHFVTNTLPRSPSELQGIALRHLTAVRESEDGREGRAAAREKRKPKFIGR